MLVGPARAWRGSPGGGSIEPENMPLVQAADVQFVGAFRVPNRQDSPTESFSWGGGAAMSVNPVGTNGQKTLFIAGRTDSHQLAELSIPTPDPESPVSSLPVATVLQGFKDPSEGDYTEIYPPGAVGIELIGSLVKGNDLFTSYCVFYGSSDTLASLFKSSKNFATSGHIGPLTFDKTGHRFEPLGEEVYGQRWFAGPLCHVPTEWQSRLGGDVLVGVGERATTQRNSVGPSATTFWLSDVGVTSPIPCNALLGYCATKYSITTGPLAFPHFHLACRAEGIAIPKGTRTYMAIGKYGTGTLTGFEANNMPCYGTPTTDPAYINNPDSPNYCYSLVAGANKNFIAYPYRRRVWLYDLLELQSVKDGEKHLDEVLPYSVADIPWPEHLDFDDACQMACAIDNDATPPRLYVSMYTADQNESPLIAVFDIVTGV